MRHCKALTEAIQHVRKKQEFRKKRVESLCKARISHEECQLLVGWFAKLPCRKEVEQMKNIKRLIIAYYVLQIVKTIVEWIGF